MAKKSLGDGVIGISGDLRDEVVLDRGDDAAGISAIAIAGCLYGKGLWRNG